MQKRPQLHNETTERQIDGETLAYRNLWSEVLNRAIADAESDRYRKSVYGFLCSPACEHLCQLLSLDVQAVRNRVVPRDLQPGLIAQQAALAAANRAAFKQRRQLSYYKRKRRHEQQIHDEILRRKAGAIAPGYASLYRSYVSIPADCHIEVAITRLMEHSSLDEWEAFIERIEMEHIIQQQPQEQTA